MSDWEEDDGGNNGWNDTPAVQSNYGGTNTGKGRGFKVNSYDDDDSYNGNSNHTDSNSYNGGGGFGGGSFREDRRGGRGGRGGRGPRGGGNRGGRGGNFNNDKQFDDADNEFDSFGGSDGGRGFRGRGGGRDRNRDQGDKGFGEDGDKPEKPRERYIPPERENEDDLFAQGISTGINFDKFDTIEVKVTGEFPPCPIETFNDAGLREFVLNNVIRSGYRRPTPVQKYSIPIVMAGRDLMACAQTGSGKTAAFLVPIINTLLSDPWDLITQERCAEPQAVIMSPTRELAIQIYDEARKFSVGSIIKTEIAYGGTATFHQAKKVARGCHILVATAGRLIDFLKRGNISFKSLRFFVLDEADRMLDMGFLPNMEEVLDHPTMAEKRQTLMFSATFPRTIQELAGRFLKNYLFLTVGIVGGACSDVVQNFHQVTKYDKRKKLEELLREDEGGRILVFVEKKRQADFLATYLSENDFPTTSIHGDRQQREREEALADFRSGRMKVLVATAVANRGLDIKDVSHVIFYDLPKQIEDYVHGIGRTGRVGNRGKATSFFNEDDDAPLAGDIVKILKQANQEVPDWLESAGFGGGSGFRPSSNFGARDYRKFDNPIAPPPDNQGMPIAVESDEQW